MTNNTIDLDSLVYIVNKIENHYRTKIIGDKSIILECIKKTDEYLKTLKNPSDYKVASAIAFWIRKLKPFSFKLEKLSKNPTQFLNEKIAILYGYNYIKTVRKENDQKIAEIKPKLFADLAIQLRYSSFSPSSMALIFESLNQ